MSPADHDGDVFGLDEAREQSTGATPAHSTQRLLSGWFNGEMVELTDVHLGDGALDKEPNGGIDHTLPTRAIPGTVRRCRH